MASRVFAVTLLVEAPDNLAPPKYWQWDKLINYGLPVRKRTPVLTASAYEVEPNTRASDEQLRH